MELDITPVPKPRMTQQDKFRKRRVTQKYWAFCKELLLRAREKGLKELPETYGVTFVLPMPKSWSKKKRTVMDGTPHKQTPDLDNLMKAFKDALAKDDSHVHCYTFVSKRWGERGKIIIFEENG